MNVGDQVRIVKCEECPKVVGKTVKVTEIQTVDQGEGIGRVGVGVKVSFGRGRPQLGRPNEFIFADVVRIEGE